MYRAEVSLTFFKYLGIYPSPEGIFTVYSIFVIFLMILFTISSLLYLFVENMELEEFFDSIFYFFGICTVCIRLIVFVINRAKIFEITDILLNKQFAPRDPDEVSIQNGFDTIGRTGSIAFACFTVLAVATETTIPLIRGDFTSLPYGGWMPYHVENRTTFWLSYVFQCLGMSILSIVIIASDSFIITMLLQLCAQIEILIHRINKFVELHKIDLLHYSEKEQTFFADWVEHHNSLYDFRKKLNNLFASILLCQLMQITFNVCLGAYLLATFSVTSLKFWSMILTMMYLLVEIYIFCLHGNLVTEKSNEIGYAVFSIDWTLLSCKSKKSLIFIIGRSKMPIKLTAGPNIPLSINTFTSILRLAYSIYNCLKQQQKTEL